MYLKELQEKVSEWHYQNFGLDVSAHWPLLVALEELGELAHYYVRGKMLGVDNLAKEYDSVGDILIALAAFCYREEIDIQEAFENAFEEVKKRDYKLYPNNGRTE